MKKFYFLTLALICAFVANASNIGANAKLYFDGTDWGHNYVNFLIGHDSWSSAYNMTKIQGTNLYYKNMPQWNGFTKFVILGCKDAWNGDEGSGVSTRKGYADYSTSEYTSTYDFYANNTYLLTRNENVLNMPEYISEGYNGLNHTQTINVDGVGSVTVSSVKLSSANATTATSETATVTTDNETSTASTSIDAAYTATVTCVATPGEGESFVGWFEGENCLSDDETYSYVATNAPKTIKAEFSKSTAIEEVGVDAGEAVYYNLQGVKVANPENGIFIKKQGGRTSKVVL